MTLIRPQELLKSSLLLYRLNHVCLEELLTGMALVSQLVYVWVDDMRLEKADI